MVMGVNFVARRCKKPRATKFIFTGNENISERATKFIFTGNKIYRHGQRNFEQQATEILHKSLCFFAKGEHIEFFFRSALYIYALAKKKINI